MLTQAQALAAFALQKNNTVITPEGVKDLLVNTKGTTFAEIATVTPVKFAAAPTKDGVKAVRVTVANVQLFNGLKDYNVYANAVKRSAEKLGWTNPFNIKDFEAQDNWFAHTDCFSIVQNRKDPEKFYLYAIYNKAESAYVMNNTVVSKEIIAQYLTPAAARELMSPPTHNVNVTHDVTHNVIVRVISLDNVVGIKAMGYELTVEE